MEETWVWSLGWEDLLEKEMATHSSTLAWKIPWTGEPGRLQSMGLQRVGHNWATSLSFTKCTAAAAKSLQSCPTLCDPMDCNLPGSPVYGIFQAIVLECIAISFSSGSSLPRDQTQVSHIVDRRFTVYYWARWYWEEAKSLPSGLWPSVRPRSSTYW